MNHSRIIRRQFKMPHVGIGAEEEKSTGSKLLNVALIILVSGAVGYGFGIGAFREFY